MLEFPQTTAFCRRVPKQKFYENTNLSASVRRLFAVEIENIVWRNKFSPDTLNVEKGREVAEIELLQITLRQKALSKPVLKTMAAAIPYHLVFLLEYLDEFQLAVAFSPDKGKLLWYSSPWQASGILSLQIQGLNLDEIYENFVRQIAGAKLAGGVSLQADVERERARVAVQKRIATLTRKIRAEKQFNRQVELNRALREAKAELAALDY